MLLKTDEWDAIHAVRDAIRAHPFASILLAPEDGEAEVSIAWVDGETGVYCRARPDFLNHAHNVVVDLKTATDASYGVFARACANYTYHLQAAFYLDGMAAVKKPHDKFIFVGAEPEPPFAVACYELDAEDLRVARVRYRQALRTYQQCLASNTWPSYPEQVRTLELPAWAKFVPIS
jgi:exodeoxyribonuclease VIII